MKTLIQSLLFFFTCLSFSQVPELISYRAIATNSTGNVIVSSAIGIKISILDNTIPIFAEAHTKITDVNGAYNLNIGGGAFLSGITFNNINWGTGGNKFLKVEIDPNGGTNYSINVGTTQLLSVPYAFMAKEVVNINGAMVNTISDLRNYTAYANNKVVYVKGYYVPGDGGEGFFIWKDNPTYEKNGNATQHQENYGTIIQPNTPPPTFPNGKWMRQYSGAINVNYFGVRRSWDDISSNADRIQKIIDYANQFGQESKESDMTIYFPNGDYFIDKPLILKDKVKLMGGAATVFTVKPNSTYDYMIKMGSGPITSCGVENITLNLRDVEGIGGIHLKGSAGPDTGGIWNSYFKYISIVNLKGHGIYLEGGGINSGWNLPNQYLVFENVRVIRKSAEYNSLKMTGQQNTSTFLNCTFDAIPAIVRGINISMFETNPAESGAAVISFINCAIGGTEIGVLMNNTENVTFDNCFFEDLDITFDIRSSRGINIFNNRFANAAGHGSDDNNPSFIPAGTGRCISVENSFVNIENNHVAVTSPGSPATLNEKFIFGSGNNNVINVRNNSFQHPSLSETSGIMQSVVIASSSIDIWSKKLVFINAPSTYSSATNDVSKIKSDINAGETIFLRANGGTVKFLPMPGVVPISGGSNIFLNGRASLTLTNGQAATFIKIDNAGGNIPPTYQLMSIAN